MHNTTSTENTLCNRSGSTVSRREFLTISAAGVGAVTAAGYGLSAKGADASDSHSSGSSSKASSRPAPFDTLREYIEALEERGLVLRFKKLDQDNYEMTALMYRLIDQYGWEEAPVILAEQVKINGEWVKGPLISNHHGHLDTEAIVFGVEPAIKDPKASYRKAMAYLQSRLVKGSFPMIEPIEVEPDKALCKEVVLTGDQVDLTKFAFIKSNPADAPVNWFTSHGFFR